MINPNFELTPETDVDPFSDEFLTNPYAFHEDLRSLGPVFKLTKYDVLGMAGYAEVSGALNDWGTFCSSRGVGLRDFAREEPWRPPSLLLETDPPVHDRTRTIMRRILSRSVLESLKSGWAEKADSLIDDLVRRRTFDAVKDLGEIYPLSVFPDAVGIREAGRENLLPYGALAFNSFGPANHLLLEGQKTAEPVAAWVADSCRRESLAVGGFGAAVFEAADRGEVTHDEAERLVRSFLSAGVDTTVNSLGNTMHCFVKHPQQWEKLVADPKLTVFAFEEALRYESTLQTLFRTTTREVEVAGIKIPEGQKVMLFLGSANRDPLHWDNPESFNIARKASGHVGFGAGIHACVGQMIARLEAELVMTALIKRVSRIESDGSEKRRLNNTLFALESLPVKVVPH